jgi:hypothetical protein
MSSSPDKFCDGRTEGQTDGQTDDREVIPICCHYSVEATQKWCKTFYSLCAQYVKLLVYKNLQFKNEIITCAFYIEIEPIAK